MQVAGCSLHAVALMCPGHTSVPCTRSDMSIHEVSVSAAESQAIVDEALGLRRKRQALTVREKEPDLKLVQPIPFLT